jgi:hypothetical protein
MTFGDVFGGSVERHSSEALVASYTVIPTAPRPGTAPAPFVVTSYEIWQHPTGNGVVLLFYDAAAAPAPGTPWFGNLDTTQNVQWAVAITPNGGHPFPLPPAGHRYLTACTIVVSAGTDVTQLQPATAKTLICVDGFPWLV